jgi:hemolysin III
LSCGLRFGGTTPQSGAKEHYVSAGKAGGKLPVNPWPHAVAAGLAAIALAYLIARFRLSGMNLAVMCVYGCGLVVLFGASAVYHAVGGRRPALTPVLRRVDHASIYLMMAASYTPLAYFGLDGLWRSVSMLVFWALSLLGAVISIWLANAPRGVRPVLYAAFGWAAVIPGIQLAERLPHSATALIAAGGIFYTLGAIVYATKTLDFAPGRFGFHEVFHCLVVAGAAVQFVAIAFYVAPPA